LQNASLVVVSSSSASSKNTSNANCAGWISQRTPRDLKCVGSRKTEMMHINVVIANVEARGKEIVYKERKKRKPVIIHTY